MAILEEREASFGGTCSLCGGKFRKGADVALTTSPRAAGFWAHKACAVDEERAG